MSTPFSQKKKERALFFLIDSNTNILISFQLPQEFRCREHQSLLCNAISYERKF